MFEFENVVVQDKRVRESAPGSKRKWRNVSLNIDGNWHSCFVNQDNQKMLDSIEPGDAVSMNTQMDGKYSNIVDIVLVKKASPAQAAAATAKNESKDLRIFYSGLQKVAGAVVSGLLQAPPESRAAGIIPLSAKKGDNAAELMGFFKFVTDTLASQVEEYIESKTVVEESDEG